MKATALMAPAGAGSVLTVPAHLLSNTRYATLITAGGGGFSALDEHALTRWVPDPARESGGFALYIRDTDAGTFWSTARFPACPHAGSATRRAAGVLGFDATEHGIESQLDICVCADHAAEIRRLTLRNTGEAPRRLDVTTCAELALNTPAADAAHPAFSKLFIQTAYEADLQALLAWRRPRSPEDQRLWAAHVLLSDDGATVEYETDRMRFIGRGRQLAAPRALLAAAALTGTTGNVLDPLFSMRRAVVLQPGESAVVAAVFAAAEDRADVLRTVRQLSDATAVAAAFHDARAASSGAAAALGIPAKWLEHISITPVGNAAAAATPGVLRGDAQRLSRAVPIHALPPRGGDAGARHPGATGAGAEPLSDAPWVFTEAAALSFWNGWGGFTGSGSEYVIRMPLRDGVPLRPPLPWVNVIANEEAGCIVSESGAMYTWAVNSRENRITPWFNDPVCDPHGEALYIRDDEDGSVWSPTPGPCPGAGDYEVRHGFGYTQFLHRSGGLDQDVRVFVPTALPARVAVVRLANTQGVPRRITVCSYAQLVLGSHEADGRGLVQSWSEDGALFARNCERGEFAGRIAFAAALPAGAPGGWTTDRLEFLGAGGDAARPAALAAGTLQGTAGTGLDPCFALTRSFVMAPGETVTCAFILGEAADEAAARATLSAVSDTARVERLFDGARAAWRDRLGAVHIETPVPAIDLMVNGWLAYQNLGCRMWARSAYYQSGGAFGFRDQLQDASALLWLDPAHTRRQILLHAAHQFVEGDVLHWWHPPLSKGIRTRFSDDLLWLPYVTAFYVQSTGDDGILDEHVRFVTGEPLAPGEDENFLYPEEADTAASLYEHCCRALDRSLTTGVHGLPLIGVGDWNDGMNRVGREGRGESVWLGFFLFDILEHFIPLCGARGDAARADSYGARRRHLAQALNDSGWDGAWYRRAYYDNGTPLGSAGSDECRIDALAQAWAVLSGAAPEARASQALDALERLLVSERDGIIRLLTPAFDRTPNDPGYIKGYLPGVRENGGQYTHGVLWAVRALAEDGRADRAATLLGMLSPVTRGGTRAGASRYMVEPYVIAADVYGEAPHVGRGGWTWYTGSAGWFCRVALESILGLEPRRGSELLIRPSMPHAWPGFKARWRLPDGTIYHIEVVRDDGAAATCATLDGGAVGIADGAAVVPLERDGAEHVVTVTLGADAGRRYSPRLP